MVPRTQCGPWPVYPLLRHRRRKPEAGSVGGGGRRPERPGHASLGVGDAAEDEEEGKEETEEEAEAMFLIGSVDLFV